MSFNGNEGEQISLTQGAELTGRYQTASPDSIKAVFYGANHIKALLEQPNCMGIRMYFAQEPDGSNTLVLVGVDSNENDLLELVIENGLKCPFHCSGTNPLNANPKSGAR